MLQEAVANGLSLLTWEQDTFGYAESYDEESGRYRGLRAGQAVSINEGDSGLIVRPEVARRQLDAEAVAIQVPEVEPPIYPPAPGPTDVDVTKILTPPKARRYHGSVKLDPTRLGRDASVIADSVIAHLSGVMGANVRLTLEIEVDIPDGTPEQVVRIVTENSRTLKFDDSGFESE